MYTLLNTLYVMTPHAYAHLENATVRIDVEREKNLQGPLHHIGGLVCFGNVMVSPAIMHRLADEGKSLVLLEDSGRFKARLEGPVSGNTLLRQAQHQQAASHKFALEIARAIVAGKLKNSRSVVMRGARETFDSDEAATLTRTADDLAGSLRAVKDAPDLDTLRGLEGEAARGYFAALKPECPLRGFRAIMLESTNETIRYESGASPGLTAGRGLKHQHRHSAFA
jgi:CRISP-associated protein Cas1